MKMRPPAIPLITVDPYFSIWSPSTKLTDSTPMHWTGSPNTIVGNVNVDGEELRFMGSGTAPAMRQIYFDMSAMVTDYVFESDKIRLSVSFFSTLFTDDLYRLSRPVSYMTATYSSVDGKSHQVKLTISASEELCINKKGEEPVIADEVSSAEGLTAIRVGSDAQRILWRYGDNIRIDWGYFYLATLGTADTSIYNDNGMTFISLSLPLTENNSAAVAFAYDDVHCLKYFGKICDAYWKARGISIEEAIVEALDESELMLEKCREFSKKLEAEATERGGEKYADLLSLAYRQVIAAHKLALNDKGEIIFISKECFSNGCAATVDVTYPSSPLMLIYNTELLKGTLRPIFEFAASDGWEYDFAPHDAGRYPDVFGQIYGLQDGVLKYELQMPVEECGNMLIMMANLTLIDKNTDFAKPHMPVLEQWVKYLIEYGKDPGNQLCTDDFAGHLAHNCNLSLKAVMGIAGYSLILKAFDRLDEAEEYMNIAKDMAKSWVERAQNADGSFRLAFDRPDSFSMKYNVVWDKLWGTGLFPPYVLYSEFCSNKKQINAYGMPLDNRRTYTKSDWLLWTAMLSPTKEEFEEFIAPLWLCYNSTPSRVPMTDWYDTVTSCIVGFQHRSVQGGLFIKLLEGGF